MYKKKKKIGCLPRVAQTSTSCGAFAGGERDAAPAGRALPVPAQRLAGVCHHPLRRPAGWSRLRQHLLLYQQGGQVIAASSIWSS